MEPPARTCPVSRLVTVIRAPSIGAPLAVVTRTPGAALSAATDSRVVRGAGHLRRWPATREAAAIPFRADMKTLLMLGGESPRCRAQPRACRYDRAAERGRTTDP